MVPAEIEFQIYTFETTATFPRRQRVNSAIYPSMGLLPDM